MAEFADEVLVAAPPAYVRDWWTCDVPQGREFETTFRSLGIPMRMRERFFVNEAGWRFVTRAPFGLDVEDAFAPEPASGGTLVRIRCSIRGRSLLGRLALPFYLPVARRQFRRRWREAAERCAKDASSA